MNMVERATDHVHEDADRRASDRMEAHDREHKLLAEMVAREAQANRSHLDGLYRRIANIHERHDRDLAALIAAHDREHHTHDEFHQREHQMQADALTKADAQTSDAIHKAEQTLEHRFEAVNAFREQLRDQSNTLASRESVEALRADLDRRTAEQNKRIEDHTEALTKTTQTRFDQLAAMVQDKYDLNRQAIVDLQKTDVEGRGKELGRTATIAVIIGAISFAGTFIGLLILLAGLLDKTPAA